MESRINHLSVFSEEELALGLAILGTPETAPVVAAQVYAIPAAEQVHYEWIDTALMMTSCVSDELATRILDRFGRTAEERAALEAQMRAFQEWVKGRGGKPGRTPLTMEDVIFDTRIEQVYEGPPVNHVG
ncbi:hypothetical protein SAMN05216486_10183 [bacterium JGI 053]|nr:hypothetical protein SAMN05216486_10183 [bacterium JGI 053]